MNNIPGFITDAECQVLDALARSVNKKGAIIVEIGSLHGKSTSILANACDQGIVYAIDPWWGTDTSAKDIDATLAQARGWPAPGTLNTLKFFRENTRDCPNIIPLQTMSPGKLSTVRLNIDMVFLDAAHTNPSDRTNIDFWLPQVRKGGIFAGHDLSGDWPDVKSNILYLEQRLAKKVISMPGTSIWYFII